MNAKKLILLGASAMLLASCGQSLNRADAIATMDAISKATVATQTKLTYVKEYKEKNTGTNFVGKEGLKANAETKAVYMYSDGTDYSEKEAGEKVKSDVWSTKTADNVYTVAYQVGEDKYAFNVENSGLEAATYAVLDNLAATKIAAAIKTGQSAASKDNGYGYCGFLAKFPEGEGEVKAGEGVGATFHANAHIQDESYVKNGEGSISCSYNAVYENQGDEVMKAEWKENILIAKSNAKLSSSGYGFETWDYKKADISAPKTEGWSAPDALTKAAILLVLGIK